MMMMVGCWWDSASLTTQVSGYNSTDTFLLMHFIHHFIFN